MYLLFLHSFFHNSETCNNFLLYTATDFRFSNCEKQLHHRLDTFFMILSQNVTLCTRDHVVFGCGLSYESNVVCRAWSNSSHLKWARKCRMCVIKSSERDNVASPSCKQASSSFWQRPSSSAWEIWLCRGGGGILYWNLWLLQLSVTVYGPGLLRGLHFSAGILGGVVRFNWFRKLCFYM